jgi:hypothetical protein
MCKVDVWTSPDDTWAMAARNAYQDTIWEQEVERSAAMVDELITMVEIKRVWRALASSEAIEHAIREASKRLRRAIVVVGYNHLDERVLNAVDELEHALILRPQWGLV